MADLKEALSSLSPINYSALPSGLESFLRDSFRYGELIINSIPPSPDATTSTSEPPRPPPNTAHKAIDTQTSARSTALDARNAELQKVWGKPVKISQKDNPLHVTVYKMTASDKGSTWFARRSVHQNIGFLKWKHAWQAEFGESEKVEGGPGAGAIRGITADRRVEVKHVEGVGEVQVWQLSAAFPGPTSPRAFTEQLLVSDNALTSVSALDGNTSGKPPRHMMVISRPTTHSDVSPSQNLVRATYESVEMIRELPVDGQSDPELNPVEWLMITRSDPGGGIPRFMVERGTPGSVVGDTSKFLDWACARDEFAKTETDGVAHENGATEDEKSPVHASEGNSAQSATHLDVHEPGMSQISTADATTNETTLSEAAPDSMASSGMLSSAMNYMGQTATSAAGYLPGFSQPLETSGPRSHDSEPSSPASDAQSFMSADDGSETSPSSSKVLPQPDLKASSTSLTYLEPNRARASTTLSDANSVTSSIAASQHTTSASITNILLEGQRQPSNNHEKELLKIHKRMQDLDAKTAKERAEDDARSTELETESASLDTANADIKAREQHAKARENHAKARQKRDEKNRKEMEKLEEKQSKEEEKAAEQERKDEEKRKERERKEEEKRRKDEGRDEIARLNAVVKEREAGRRAAEAEAEMLRKEVDVLRKEVAGLRARLQEDAVAG